MKTVPSALALALSLTALAAVPLEAREVHARRFDTRILEPDAAEAIVLERCDAREAACTILSVRPSSISVESDPKTLAAVGVALADAQRVPSARIFQVTLIKAENNGDEGLGDVPEPARRALEDARGFLPFRGYQLLGTAVLRTDEAASAMVSGPEGLEFDCEIAFRNSITREGLELVIRRFSLARMPPRTGSGQYVEGAGAVDVLNTSFGMKPGETVVVGTSKLEEAGRALVVLLTAVD